MALLWPSEPAGNARPGKDLLKQPKAGQPLEVHKGLPMLRSLLTLSLMLAIGSVCAEDAKPIPYTLDTCIVSGEKLGEMGDAVVKVIDGREVKFCCAGCIKKYNKDPAKYLAEADAKMAAAAKAAPAEAPKPAVEPAKHDH